MEQKSKIQLYKNHAFWGAYYIDDLDHSGALPCFAPLFVDAPSLRGSQGAMSKTKNLLFYGRSLRLSSFKKWDLVKCGWLTNTLMVFSQHETIIHESLRRAFPNYVIQQLADSSSPGPLGLENDHVSTNLVKNTPCSLHVFSCNVCAEIPTTYIMPIMPIMPQLLTLLLNRQNEMRLSFFRQGASSQEYSRNSETYLRTKISGNHMGKISGKTP